MGLVGKTIARVEEVSYGDTLRLHFTDGTVADLESTGYDASGVQVELKTQADLHRERIAAAQHRLAADAIKQAAIRRRDARRAEMKAILTPRQYELWLKQDGGIGPFAKAMQDEYAAARKQQVYEFNRQTWGATWGP